MNKFKTIFQSQRNSIHRNVQSFEIRVKNIEIPSQHKTYWRKVKKLHDVHKMRHIVEIEPIIENDNFVHHIIVYHCEVAANVVFPMFEGRIEDQPEEINLCSKSIAIWVCTKS